MAVQLNKQGFLRDFDTTLVSLTPIFYVVTQLIDHKLDFCTRWLYNCEYCDIFSINQVALNLIQWAKKTWLSEISGTIDKEISSF